MAPRGLGAIDLTYAALDQSPLRRAPIREHPIHGQNGVPLHFPESPDRRDRFVGLEHWEFRADTGVLPEER